MTRTKAGTRKFHKELYIRNLTDSINRSKEQITEYNATIAHYQKLIKDNEQSITKNTAEIEAQKDTEW